MGSTLTFEVSSSGSEAPLPSKGPLSLRLHQRGLNRPEEPTVGLGARQRGAGGQGLAPSLWLGWGGGSHLPRLPEKFTAMLGADTLGGRRAEVFGGSSAAPPPEEVPELPAPLPLIAWQRPFPMWLFLKMIKAP